MRIRMTNAWRRTAAACRAALDAVMEVVRDVPEHLQVLIDIYSIGDLSAPRR
ncbi:MAG TPA: hypothetical protein VEN30_32075 [Paraburkholderia sp.]|nr:hypothetical protein [Paraburkholderia sp.]